MRKDHCDHGFTRRPVGETAPTGHPSKVASTNAEVLEEILQAAGLEDLN